MSDTPRCNALHDDLLRHDNLTAWMKLAAELERELAGLQDRTWRLCRCRDRCGDARVETNSTCKGLAK